MEARPISIAIMAVVSFVVVGVSPRTLGRQHYDAGRAVERALRVGLRRGARPVAKLLIVLGNAVTPGKGFTRRARSRPSPSCATSSTWPGTRDVIEADEREMIHSVFELGDTLAREVMVPRTDMVVHRRRQDAAAARCRCSCAPASPASPSSARTSTTCVGLLYFKDVVAPAQRRPGGRPASWSTEVMRPMHFVPESKPVDDLLREMQRDQSHFADRRRRVRRHRRAWSRSRTSSRRSSARSPTSTTGRRPASSSSRTAPCGSPRRWTSTTSPSCSTSTIDEDDVDTVGGLHRARSSAGCPSSARPVRSRVWSLTAERMAGRRHRVASVIVHRAAPCRRTTPRTPRRRTPMGTQDADPTPGTRREGMTDRWAVRAATVAGFACLVGPAQRRQVDADQRARRAEGRDHELQAADDAAHDPRHRHDRRTPS